MSINGTEREFYFNLYLRDRKFLLENVTGVGLADLLLEKPWEEGLKLDISGYDRGLGIQFIVETVLARSNVTHQQKVQSILDHLDAGNVVYQATSFQDKNVRELEERVFGCKKPIRLFLVQISHEVLEPLEQLNRMHKLEVYWHLADTLDKVQKPLSLYKTIENPQFASLKPQPLPKMQGYDFSRRTDVKKYLLYELRRRVPSFLPVQREKNFAEHDPTIIYLGGGRSGIGYFLSAMNGRGQALVELMFGEANSHLFQLFAMKPWLLQEKIDARVEVDENLMCISCRFTAHEDVRKTVRELARIFEGMVQEITYDLFNLIDVENYAKSLAGKKTRVVV